MDGPEVFKAWGLPAYFSQFSRVLGASSTKVAHGPVDSGDFLESDAVFDKAFRFALHAVSYGTLGKVGFSEQNYA
jgi:hypothetical protein